MSRFFGDLKLFMDINSADIDVEDRDALQDAGLETAIIISLFTDARVFPEELPEGLEDLGGFWGDLILEESVGSKLWTLRRKKLNNTFLNNFEEFAVQALSWMIEEQIASSIKVDVNYIGDTVNFEIRIKRPEKDLLNFRYSLNWEKQILRRN